MSLEELYNWQGKIREMIQDLGYWQSLTLAMYSLGMVLARQSAPSKVAEKLGVLGRYGGERVILLVDETKLGQHLSVMMVGLAYRSCCVPLAWWAYDPKAWPLGQVALIETLLGWVAQALPSGLIPLLQADRGMGTSPALVRVVERLGWHYLFRVQKSVILRHAGHERALKHL